MVIIGKHARSGLGKRFSQLWICLILLLCTVPAFANNLVFISTNYPSPAAQNYAQQFTNVIAADAGSDTVVLLLSNGRLAEFTNAVGTPLTIPLSVTNVTAMATWDTYYCMALKSNGTISVWGYGSTVTNVPNILSNVTAMAAGWRNCLTLLSNGTVVSWGDITNVPQGLSNVVSVSAGRDDNLALRANGTVTEWGSGTNLIAAGLSNVIAISSGWTGNMALLMDGTVVSWDNTSRNVVVGVTNAVGISRGSNRALILQPDGSLVLWGAPTSFNQPVSNVFHVSVSSFTDVDTVITGDGSPVFTVQPGNQSVTAGDAIYLHARTVGTQPINLQWQHNGTNVPGATNGDLILTNVSLAESGNYRAVATNVTGQAASSLATITVSALTVPVLLSAPMLQFNGSIAVTASTVDGATFPITTLSSFALEASSDLNEWNVLTNEISLTNNAIFFTDPAAATNPARFYRLFRQ